MALRGECVEFSIAFYETPDGRPVVEEEMEAIERRAPVLHDLLVAGLSKLRRREYHRPPLCEPLGGGLYELRVGRKDIARAAWFFREQHRIVIVRCFVKKTQKTPDSELALARKRMADYLVRWTGR
jgi:phage-related protein